MEKGHQFAVQCMSTCIFACIHVLSFGGIVFVHSVIIANVLVASVASVVVVAGNVSHVVVFVVDGVVLDVVFVVVICCSCRCIVFSGLYTKHMNSQYRTSVMWSTIYDPLDLTAMSKQ